MKIRLGILALIILVLCPTLLGCTAEPTLTPSPLSPTQTATRTPIPSPTPTVTPSPTPVPHCPAIVPDVQFVAPQTNDEVDDRVLAYLNAGGDPEQIPALIKNLFTSDYSQTLDAVTADLNGDDLGEVFLAGSLSWENPANVYIFACGAGAYEVKATIGLYGSPPRVLGIESLISTYPPQIILRHGAVAGWASSILVIGWDGTEWKLFLRESFLFPDISTFDQDGDGNKEIFIASDTTTHGASRTMIDVYDWNGEEFALSSHQVMPGDCIVHYLADAQQALDEGNLALAIGYYDRAAHDESLCAFPSTWEFAPQEVAPEGAGRFAQQYQTSFALFRTATLLLGWGDPQAATRAIEELQHRFPENTPGNEFTQAALLFQAQMAAGEIPPEACQAVTDFFDTNYPSITQHIGDWWFAGISYWETSELCPFP